VQSINKTISLIASCFKQEKRKENNINKLITVFREKRIPFKQKLFVKAHNYMARSKYQNKQFHLRSKNNCKEGGIETN